MRRAIKKLVHAYSMAQSMFCAIPFPCVWDEQARGWMLPCLPAVGLVIGGLWCALRWALEALGLPAPLGAALLAVFAHVQSDEKRMRDFGNGRGARNLVQDMTQSSVVSGRVLPDGRYALTVDDLPREYRSFAARASRPDGGAPEAEKPHELKEPAQPAAPKKSFFVKKENNKF